MRVIIVSANRIRKMIEKKKHKDKEISGEKGEREKKKDKRKIEETKEEKRIWREEEETIGEEKRDLWIGRKEKDKRKIKETRGRKRLVEISG